MSHLHQKRPRASSTWIFGQTDNINNHYQLGANLGQAGQFGRAQRATKRRPKPGEPTEYAVKVINKSRFARCGSNTAKIFQSFRNEVEIMSRLDHPNLIKYYECYEDQLTFYIVMELCEGGELFDRISSMGNYSEKDAAAVLKQLFEAVQYLHSAGIVHCDLKPDNFLFKTNAKDSPVKIIDFGMSKLVQPKVFFSKFCGTPYYVAPEVIAGRYKEACDMWSMGVIMFVMLHGYPPFHADPAIYGDLADQKILTLIKSGFQPVIKKGYKNHFPEAIPISPGARSLITKLLQTKVADRLTAVEALEHPWMLGKTASETPIDIGVVRSLMSFTKANRLKQHVLDLMTGILTAGDIQRLKTSFNAMDEDGDGNITIEELRKSMLKVQGVDNAEVARIMQEVDIDGDGKLSYRELMLAYVQRKLNQKEERLWEAFCKLDVNGDGTISVDELQAVLNKEDHEEAQELLNLADKDGNGLIDYDEFLNLWSAKHPVTQEAQEMKIDG